MEVIFPPELEAKLTDSAARHGRDPDQLVRDVVSRYVEEEARFVEAVRRAKTLCSRESTSPVSKSASVFNVSCNLEGS